MSENLHDIDDLFRQNLEPMGATPGNRVWEQIEHALDKDENSRIRGKYIRWKRWAVAATLLLSCSLFALYMSNRKTGIANTGGNAASTDEKNEAAPPILTITPPDSTFSNPAETPVKNPEEIATNSSTEAARAENKQQAIATNTIRKNAPQAVHSTNKSGNTPVINSNDQGSIGGNETRKNSFIKKNRKQGLGKFNETNERKVIREEVVSTLEKPAVNDKKTVLIKEEKVTKNISNKADEQSIAGNAPPANGRITQNTTTNKKKSELYHSRPAPAAILRTGIDIKAERYSAAVLPEPNKADLPTPGKSNTGWAVTVFYEPQARFIKVQEGLRRHREDDRNDIKAGERTQTATAYGVLFDYQFPSKWRVQTGIGFTQQSSVIDPKPLFARKDDMRGGGGTGSGEIKYKFNCAAGTVFLDPKTGISPVVGDTVMALASVNKNRYIQIPLRVSYKFNFGKFSVSPTVGLQSNILQESTLQTTLVDNTGAKTPASTPIEGLRSLFMTAEFGAGIEYNLSKRLSVYLMPRAGFSLSPINKETPVRTYTRELSAVTGLRFQL